MTPTQQKAYAAAFIHALRESADVRDGWYSFRRNLDWDGLCGFIGTTLGVPAPTRGDLDAMCQHAQEALLLQMSEVYALDNRVTPACVYNGGDCHALLADSDDSNT
jgi:hypothetical protein